MSFIKKPTVVGQGYDPCYNPPIKRSASTEQLYLRTLAMLDTGEDAPAQRMIRAALKENNLPHSENPANEKVKIDAEPRSYSRSIASFVTSIFHKRTANSNAQAAPLSPTDPFADSNLPRVTIFGASNPAPQAPVSAPLPAALNLPTHPARSVYVRNPAITYPSPCYVPPNFNPHVPLGPLSLAPTISTLPAAPVSAPLPLPLTQQPASYAPSAPSEAPSNAPIPQQQPVVATPVSAPIPVSPATPKLPLASVQTSTPATSSAPATRPLHPLFGGKLPKLVDPETSNSMPANYSIPVTASSSSAPRVSAAPAQVTAEQPQVVFNESLTAAENKRVAEYGLPILVPDLSAAEKAKQSPNEKMIWLVKKRGEGSQLRDANTTVENYLKSLTQLDEKIRAYNPTREGSLGFAKNIVALQACQLSILEKVYPEKSADERKAISTNACIALARRFITLATARIALLDAASSNDPQTSQPQAVAAAATQETKQDQLNKALLTTTRTIKTTESSIKREQKKITDAKAEISTINTALDVLTKKGSESLTANDHALMIEAVKNYEELVQVIKTATSVLNGDPKSKKTGLLDKLADLKRTEVTQSAEIEKLKTKSAASAQT